LSCLVLGDEFGTAAEYFERNFTVLIQEQENFHKFTNYLEIASKKYIVPVAKLRRYNNRWSYYMEAALL